MAIRPVFPGGIANPSYGQLFMLFLRGRLALEAVERPVAGNKRERRLSKRETRRI